jgi:predicted RNase H-like HicB family nuclease
MELHAPLHEEDGSYWAEVRELPGCFASGHTLDEVFEGLREAIALCVPGEPTSLRVDELRLVTAPTR